MVIMRSSGEILASAATRVLMSFRSASRVSGGRPARGCEKEAVERPAISKKPGQLSQRGRKDVVRHSGQGVK